MKDWQRLAISYASLDTEQKQHWYSPAAAAYNQVRPTYPPALIERVIAIAQLNANSRLLEIGCGPGTATVAIAPLGCPLLCLDPNPDFCQLARQNCQTCANVQIQTTTFEDWLLIDAQFDAVIAATSFHWVKPEIGYPKVAAALKEQGYLILLWNKQLQPQYEVYKSLAEVYQSYAPALDRYEEKLMQTQILTELGQQVIDSGYFTNLVSEQITSQVTYAVDDYLLLLSTYSPYLELASDLKAALFKGLRQKIEDEFDGSLQLSYESAFHIARRC